MPGIFGIISRKPDLKYEKQLEMMRACMLHDSSYTHGIHTGNAQVPFYIGWTAHRGSFADCMPVINETGDCVLVFSGENFIEMHELNALKGKNHVFNKFNAEYLVHMYEEWGEEFFDQLNGWFQGIIVDFRNNKIILFNDRFGMQRLYYHQAPDAFYFSSEAKALLRVKPELRVLNNESLGEYLCCNCVLHWNSLFENISVLPGSSSWSFKNGEISKKSRYFEPATWENQPWLEKEFFYEELRKTLRGILPRYFRASQNIGISLTGGLDTRMILSNVETPRGKFPCYTFNSIYRDCNDVRIARRVAAECGQEHHTIEVGKNFLTNFSEFAERTVYITDGNLDVSGAPEIYVNQIAKQIAPIRLTGNHGSELLRNVRWMKASLPDEGVYDENFRGYISGSLEKYQEIRTNHPLTFTLFYESPWHECNRYLSEYSQLVTRTPYHDKDLAALMFRSPPGIRESKEISLRLISDGYQNLSIIPSDRGVSNKYPFPISLLPRIYQEIFFKAEYYCNYGMPQWVARLDYLAQPLKPERFFLGRHKFYHFRVWYRDELADYVKGILLDKRTLERSYLNSRAVKKMVDSHLKGTGNFTTEITKLLTLELIQRTLIES